MSHKKQFVSELGEVPFTLSNCLIISDKTFEKGIVYFIAFFNTI